MIYFMKMDVIEIKQEPVSPSMSQDTTETSQDTSGMDVRIKQQQVDDAETETEQMLFEMSHDELMAITYNTNITPARTETKITFETPKKTQAAIKDAAKSLELSEEHFVNLSIYYHHLKEIGRLPGQLDADPVATHADEGGKPGNTSGGKEMEDERNIQVINEVVNSFKLMFVISNEEANEGGEIISDSIHGASFEAECNRGNPIEIPPELSTTIIKTAESNSLIFQEIAFQHLETLHKYYDKVQSVGKAAFKTRDEYHDFAVAKLWVDKMMVEENLYCALNNLNYVDDDLLHRFRELSNVFVLERPELAQNRKDFLAGIKNGDVLDLKIIVETETQFKLMVVNKYLEKERACDYGIEAILIISPAVRKLQFPLKPKALVRAIVFGNSGDTLLVTLNPNFLNEKYDKSVVLGEIFKSDIPYNDIHQYKDVGDYMSSHPGTSLDARCYNRLIPAFCIDPCKIYSMSPHFNGPISSHSTFTPTESGLSSESRLEQWKKSAEKLNFARFFEIWKKPERIAEVLDEAIAFYPENDIAYRKKAERCYSQVKGNRGSKLYEAYMNYRMALQLNPYHEPSIVTYSKIVILICKRLIIMKEPLGAKKQLQCLLLLHELYERKHGTTGRKRQRMTDERRDLYKRAKKLQRIAKHNIITMKGTLHQVKLGKREKWDSAKHLTDGRIIPGFSDIELEQKMKNMDTDSEEESDMDIDNITEAYPNTVRFRSPKQMGSRANINIPKQFENIHRRN